MFPMFVHWVVHSVINLIEQTKGTNPSSVPQTTKLSLTQPFRTVNNTIKQTEMRLRRQYPHGAQYSKLDKTHALKKLLSTRRQSNNFYTRHTTPKFLAALTLLPSKCVSNVNLKSKVTPRIRSLFTLSGSSPPRVRSPNREHWLETG